MKKILIAALFSAVIAIPITANAQEDTYISEEIQDACVWYGEQYNICPELLMAIIERESSSQQDATNGGCKGLMQVYEKFHKDRMERLSVNDIYDMNGNILVGTDYLSELFEKYGETSTVLQVYHGEKDAVKKSESGYISSYADGIMKRSEELERIHGKSTTHDLKIMGL